MDHSYFMLGLTSLLFLFHFGTSFNFKEIIVYPQTYIVGQTGQYTFEMQRHQNNAYTTTPWATTAVANNADITLTFPSNYKASDIASATILSLSVNSVGVASTSISKSSNVITISNAFTSLSGSNLFVSVVSIVLQNIINPIPAVYTGQFQGTIGTDLAVPNGGGIQLQPASFQSCSITFNPTVVNKTGSMIFTLNPTNALDSTSAIQIQFPVSRRWSNNVNTGETIPLTSGSMTCTGVSGSIAASPICIGDVGNFKVTANNLIASGTTTLDQFSFSLANLISPPTLQPSDLITIYSYISGDKLQQCSVYPSGLTANPLNSLTISSIETMQVNHKVGLRISMNLSDFMDTFDNIKVVFPTGLVVQYVNITGTGPFDTAKHSVTGQTLIIGLRSTVTRSFAPTQQFIVNMYNFTAPPSTAVTDGIVVSVIRNNYAKMSATTTIQAVPAALVGVTTATIKTVWATTSYKINITLDDPLTSLGYIQIYFPIEITPTLTSNCANLIGTGVVTTPTCAYNSILHMVTLTSISSGSSIGAQTLQTTILSVRNTPSIKPSDTFLVKSYYTTAYSSLVAQGTISGITATVGVIDAATATIVPSSDIVYESSVTYTFNFKSTYQIPLGGSIKILIPDKVFLSVGSITNQCQISKNAGIFSITPCSATTTTGFYEVTFTNVASSSAISAATDISLRINSQMRNPEDTGTVSGFTITVFHSDTYKIQQLTTGLSIAVSTPSAIQSMDVVSSSVQNSQFPITYTFRLNQLPPLPASSKLIITFPTDLKLTSTSTSTCQDLTGGPLTCSYSTVGSSHVLKVTLPATAITSSTLFGIKVGNIRNKPSFAPFTSTFQFLTKSNSQAVSYATGSTTPSYQNSLTSDFQSIGGVFGTRILGESTYLQVTLTPSGYIIPSYILVNLASSFTITTLTCTSATCTYNPSISHQIRVTGINTIAQMTFTISGFTAPNTAPSDKTTVTSYDSLGYKVDEDSSILFTVPCTLPCRTCATATPTVCLSCYQNTAISTYIYYYDPQKLCYVTCPATTYENTATFKCLSCNSNCLECFTVSTNCTKCNSAGSVPYLNVTGSNGQCVANCGDYHYPDTAQIPVICIDCQNLNAYCHRCTDLGVCQSCTNVTTVVGYFDNGNCHSNPDNCPADITIPNPSLNLCQPCDAVCLTCSVTIDNCVSCAAGTAKYNGDCVSACPFPLVIYNGECSVCSTRCLVCSITYDNCTSCDTTGTYPYLYINNCLTQCPQLYYKDIVLGQCKSCSLLGINCANCTTSSTCGTCDANFVFHTVDSKCYATAPTGYLNISGVAVLCDATSDCATCAVTIYNCTSCKTKILSGNNCVDTCSPGYVPVNGICTLCTQPCKNCNNLRDNCTTCDDSITPQVFLTNYQCLPTCPDFTYPNSDNNVCESCQSPCDKCSSLTSCTTCRQNFFLEDIVNCVILCRNGYLGISRVCTRCNSPCDYCSGTLDHCTTCLVGFFFVTATNKCQSTCPVGLYPNSVGVCSGCTSPCNLCSGTAQNCTSCLNNLLLLANQCLAACPDQYYPLNSKCFSCTTGCATCSSATVCLTCSNNYYLYNGNCLAQCPTSHPVISGNGVCSKCSDTSCLVCDSLDQCSSCSYPKLVHLGACLTACPTNYSTNGTNCNYDPTVVDPTNPTQPTANQTLNQTLASSNIFPVPFTIGGTFIGIACLMSKFQHTHTFIVGALYALLSILQWGSLGVALYLYFIRVSSTFKIGADYIEALIFMGGIAFLYLLNILALIVQNCYLRTDLTFRKWQNSQKPNYCWYCAVSIIGLVTTHKFKNIIFSKLFGFQVFKARLNDVQNFKVFNIFSFLSFISSAAILLGTSFMIVNYHIVDQQLMAYIDVIILTVICIILAILNSIKGTQFFTQKDQDGIIVNKRINQSETLMNQAIIPMFQENDEQQGGNYHRNVFDTQRKFRTLSQTQSFPDQQSTPSVHKLMDRSSISSINLTPPTLNEKQVLKAPPIKVQDISIQAAPILQQYSKIDFYDDKQMSSFTMFQKRDQSVNVTHQVPVLQQASVQHQPNIFENVEVSIQNNPIQEDVSIQHQVDQADHSLQHVPKADDIGIQMSREQADHSIQAAVLHNNASVQYSAKPVFQNISKDFDDGSQQQSLQQNSNGSEQQQQQSQQIPVQNQKGLKVQLQLDIDNKLRLKQQQLEQLQQEQKKTQKQNLIKNFRKQRQDRKYNQIQQKKQRDQSSNQMNRMYNNQQSRLDGSSLIGDSSNQIIDFGIGNNKKNKTQSQQKKQQVQQPHQRLNSQKTQKDLIKMLSNNNNNKSKYEEQDDVSFNVTDDLQGSKNYQNIKFEQNDRNVDSGDDNQLLELQEEKQKSPQTRGLRNQMILEEMPSVIDKSRSTNFLSTVRDRRKHQAQQNSGSSKYSDQLSQSGEAQKYDPIVDGPLDYRRRQKQGYNYKQQAINYQPRKNLTNLMNRNRNSISAQLGGRQNIPSRQQPVRDLRSQQPLPQIPINKRLKSQQSNGSDDQSYRVKPKAILYQGNKLEFEDDDRYIDTQQQQYSRGRLPRVLKSESNLKKASSKSKLGDKHITRQILGGNNYEKQYKQQLKKNDNYKAQQQELQAKLYRNDIMARKQQRSYEKKTYASKEKIREKASLQKIYKNNPFDKKN